MIIEPMAGDKLEDNLRRFDHGLRADLTVAMTLVGAGESVGGTSQV
jgi:hypothetical protein